MKTKILILIFLLIFPAVCLAATTSDTFDRSNNADLGANWDNGYSFGVSCQILSNSAANSAAGSLCLESWNADSFTDTQFAEVTIGAMTGANRCELGPVVRAMAPPDMPMVAFRASINDGSGVTSKLFMFDTAENGWDLATSSSESWTAGDKIRGTVSGTTITMYRNDVVILSCDWTTTCDITTGNGPSSGRVGIWITGDSSTSLSDCTIASWRAGDGDGSTPGGAVVRHGPIVIQ